MIPRDCRNIVWFDRFDQAVVGSDGRGGGVGGASCLKFKTNDSPQNRCYCTTIQHRRAALLIVVLCHRGLFSSHPPRRSGSNPEWDWSQFLWEHDILQCI